MKIGIVDSGLGGIVVLKECIQQHKTAHFIYYGDYQHSPYGNKNDMQLKSYYQAAMSFFLKQNCDLVIVACNTLATIIDPTEKRCVTPIMAVQKKIIESSSSNLIVLATKRTIQSKVYGFQKCNLVACPRFVKKIEKNPQSDYHKVVCHYLKKYPDAKTIVLGCTHYQLLKETIQNHFLHPITIIDSSEELVRQLSFKNSPLKIDLYVTKLTRRIQKNIATLLKNESYQLQKIKKDEISSF